MFHVKIRKGKVLKIANEARIQWPMTWMIGKIIKEMKWVMRMNESARTKGEKHHRKRVSPMISKNRGIWHSVRERMIMSGNWTCCTYVFLWTFYFPMLFAISFYVPLTNLFSIIHSPYLLITRDTQDEGEARFRFYWYRKQSKSNFTT